MPGVLRRRRCERGPAAASRRAPNAARCRSPIGWRHPLRTLPRSGTDAATRASARHPIRSACADPSSAPGRRSVLPVVAWLSSAPYLLWSPHDSEPRRPMTRAWVEIDLGALCRNGAAVAARAGVPLLPMVKADGYGLGGLRAALALESLQPWGYGVATVTEGHELRRGGITRPIIVFTPILRTEIDALRRADLTPALGDPAVIESWARTGRPWHLQIDTGMGRAGMRWDAVAKHRALLERAQPTGVFTHFHSAELDDGSRDEQEQRFAAA